MSRARAVSLSQLRPLGVALSVGCVVGALRVSDTGASPPATAWWLLAAAALLAVLWQRHLPLAGTATESPPLPSDRWRIALGTCITLGGAALWVWATRALYMNWAVSFDRTWIAWLIAAIAISIGLDVASGRWPQPAEAHRVRNLYLPLLGLVAVAALYRLGNIAKFPGEGAQTQIEDVMTGSWGQLYVFGSRGRWEYLSWAWLSALGIWLGGPTLTAMRIPFAAVSALKTIPIFIWLRLAVGRMGALAGTALFVCSSWDVVLSRIPNNHNGLIVATVFALLAGPARRGRPSAYVWLGFFSGYVLYEYVAYRPLAVFALVGATACSLRDTTVRWPARLARPLIVVALIVSMAVPLFLGRLYGRVQYEYFDGLRRARGYTYYYNAQDSWEQVVRKRIDRAAATAGLFFFVGEASPVHNLGTRPLIDPLSATLLLFGITYAAAHLWRGTFGLTLVAFLATLTGALVVTGNFDVGRAGGAVPYTYALVGYGAASVAAALQAAWRGVGRTIAIFTLIVTVAVAVFLNSQFLLAFWSSPAVNQAMRNNLPYLSTWLRTHVLNGEQVIGITPDYDYVLGPNDAAWLRERTLAGITAWDIETALRYWSRHPNKAVFFVFDGPGTGSVTRYLEGMFPDLHFNVDLDPIGAASPIAYTHQAGPPGLAEHLRTWACRGVRGEFKLLGTTPDDLLATVTVTTPFIDASAWPAAVRTLTFAAEGGIRHFAVRFASTFMVHDSGAYRFALDTVSGNAQLWIDGRLRDAAGLVAEPLSAGPHTLEVRGTFELQVVDPMVRLFWQGPDTQERQELMPFYRVSVPDPSCEAGSGAQVAPGSGPQAAS